MNWMKCVLALMLCLSLAILPGIGVDGFPKTIVDSANRTIIIEKPVEKIIPMNSWAYEPIFILGATEKLIGVTNTAQDEWSEVIPAMKEKSTIGPWSEMDYEKVIKLRPDVVLVGFGNIKTAEEKLNHADIKVIYLNFKDNGTSLQTLANIMGPNEENSAGEFITWKTKYEDQLRNIICEIGSEDRVRVYGESNYQLWYAGGNESGLNRAISAAGGRNIASNLSGSFLEVDPEWVLKENPQVIVMAETNTGLESFTGYTKNDTNAAVHYLQEISNRTAINKTDAVKMNKIFVINGYLTEVGTRNFIGAYYLAKWFYPEKLKEIDPDAIHKEYFERWLRATYRGIWAYPKTS